jgi:uncharacterized membrane protein
MKNLMMTIAVLLLTCACASIDQSKVNGKEVVTASRMNLVILGVMGAPTSKCLADLEKEGVKTVASVTGANDEASILSRLSAIEGCQATGSK